MTREEDKELLSNLIFANKKFAENLEELKKLDGLAARAAALNEIDTHKILEKLNDVSFTQISRKIVNKLNEEFEASRKEIADGAASASAAAQDLSKKAENLTVVADGFNNLDNMSQDLDEFVQKFQKMSVKSLYLGVITAAVVGIFAGSILSYSYQFAQGDSKKWSDFASKNGATLNFDKATGADTIIVPAGSIEFTIESGKNGKDILYLNRKVKR